MRRSDTVRADQVKHIQNTRALHVKENREDPLAHGGWRVLMLVLSSFLKMRAAACITNNTGLSLVNKYLRGYHPAAHTAGGRHEPC